MEISCQLDTPTALHPGKRPGVHLTGGWVGSKAGTVAKREKPSTLLSGIEHRSSRP